MLAINFYNHGSYDLVLKNRNGGGEHTIDQGDGTSTQVNNIAVGDVFDVKNLTNPKILYRPIFITDPNVTDIKLKGNEPYKPSNAQDIGNIDFQSNLHGVDLTKFNPRRVVNSFSAKPIFQGLNDGSIDYEYQGGKRVKTGMLFSATHLSEGSHDARMAYSYSAFAKAWNLGLGGSITVPVSKTGETVTGGLDFGYSQFEREERSSTNVYAYTREQRSVYEIGMDSNEGYLDTDFIIAVKQVNSVQDAYKKIIDVYGTHYATKVYYGGERSAYVSMNSSTYAKAKGFGIDIKAKLKASQKAVKKGKPTGRSSEIASGIFDFGYSEHQVEREILARTKTGYQAMGGLGGFDGWSVTEDNAVAVAVVLAPLYDLIDSRVFKDGTSRDELAQKKDYIQRAIIEYLKNLKTLGTPLPAPRLYTITLNRLEVTQAVDDLEKRTKGFVYATVNPPLPTFDGLLLHQSGYHSELRYKQGHFYTPNHKKTFVQLPESDGSFVPLKIQVHGDIAEKDHIGGSEHHRGASTSMAISHLDVLEEAKIVFDCRAFTTHAEKGNIRVTATVRRDPSDFIESVLPFDPEEPSADRPKYLTIRHTRRGITTSHTEQYANYKTWEAWGGGNWTAWINSDGKFKHQAQGANSSHTDTIIQYQTWDGSEWTATFDPARKVFTHIQRDKDSGHEDTILNYIGWDGSAWTMQIQ